LGPTVYLPESRVIERCENPFDISYPLPFTKKPSLDIRSYVTDKSLDGLFAILGEEERKIRTDPAARITPLLQQVFGK